MNVKRHRTEKACSDIADGADGGQIFLLDNSLAASKRVRSEVRMVMTNLLLQAIGACRESSYSVRSHHIVSQPP